MRTDSNYASIKGLGLLGIHIGAIAALWPAFFQWPALAAAAVVSYATVALGISLCFHRVLTHRSLRLFKPFEYLLAIFGTLALQGDPIRWVAVHRKHHAHADREGDPHSIRGGFRWAHVDWIYRHNIALPSTRGNASLRARPLRPAILSRAAVPQYPTSGRAGDRALCAGRMVVGDLGYLRPAGA